ncbi:MAG: Hsp70 family protein [Acidobacteria bacterium]|nr:Hsp70 family protein [Acidobacteriota bacterium]
MLAERVVGEAITRSFALVGERLAQHTFTANVVCPVTFDLPHRHALSRILLDQGAQSVSLSNVIDEPLAAAVLYARVATTPPVNKDLLVFDSGAGTTDVAIVRYHEEDGWKKITVLAEQGRCWAGSDLDSAVQELVANKIMQLTGAEGLDQIYRAYEADPAVGKLNFEDDCEQVKVALSNSNSYRWGKARFMGRDFLTFEITKTEFESAAKVVLLQIDAAIKSLVEEARCFVENFEGVDLALLVGGSAKVPAIKNVIAHRCSKAVIHRDEVYFDEMLATARGIGFSKDFKDIIIKRPPYTIELRATMADGSVVPTTIHKAFDRIGDWRQSYSTSVPFTEKELRLESPLETLEVYFRSPSGERQAADLQRDLFRGSKSIRARLNVKASLLLEGDSCRSKTIQMPYFTQIGLKPSRPFSVKTLNAPDVYPEDN